jgi:hypothetical protein
MTSKKTATEVAHEKSEKLLDGIAYWASFYRCNPHRFVKEYLNITLKLFQKIIIFMMMVSTNFMYLASRGQGKSWLISLYCVVRCILFPGTKIVVASGVKAQGIEIISKIDTEFLKNYSWGSQNLKNEISYISTSPNNPVCEFKNGSYIHVVTSNDNARHNRANIIVVDEFRLVDLNTINTVLRKFLTAPRQPGYLNNPKYKHLEERNCEIYASSAWYQAHWSYSKAKSYFSNMLDDRRKYVCVGLPYQLAIKEGLLSRAQVEDEMSEEDFDPISWKMEMECIFYGDSDGAFYKYDDLSKCRKIKNAYLPLSMYEKRGINVPDLAPQERRIMSVDVALMASRKHNNDAAAMWINVAIPNGTVYMSNYVFIKTFEGLTTDELGIEIMRNFYKYKCTDLVLDTQGNGLGVYDFIIKEQYDASTGETYEAMTSCNNQEMAERCKVKTANKVVWCIKATADFNSNAAQSLRAGIMNGNINLLCGEFEAEDIIKKLPNYAKMSDREKADLMLPYVQTGFAINEMINLEYEIVNNKVRIKERSGMRKDRFSSIQYNNAIVQELNTKLKPKNIEQDIRNMFLIRKAHRV